jgi:hypothetical protein
MAWDSSRPVPWPKLLKLLLLYLVLVNAIIFLLGRRDYDVGVVLSTVLGGVIYLLVTVGMVKMGVDPFSFGKRRPRPAGTASGASSTTTETAAKARPAPTKRTNAGNPRAKRR